MFKEHNRSLYMIAYNPNPDDTSTIIRDEETGLLKEKDLEFKLESQIMKHLDEVLDLEDN